MTATLRSRVEPGDRIAFGWGFGEAILFFVIPDVFLTLMAIRFGFRRSARPAIVATVGAVIGGLIMYGWATLHPSSAFAAMEALPGIDASMIETVRGDVAADGNTALLAGPLQGRPYKLFAAASGELGLSVLTLAAITIPGRLVRFMLSIGIAAYARWFFSRWVAEKVMIGAWVAFWVLVYAGYWLS